MRAINQQRLDTMQTLTHLVLLWLLYSINCWVFFASAVQEWCKASPTNGLPEFAVCQPANDAKVKYMIEVVPVVSPGIDLLSDVTIVLSGSGEKKTDKITIATSSGGTEKLLFAVAKDVGDIQSVELDLTSPKTWKCQRITVWKEYRYWVFDCVGRLDAKNPQRTLHMSGNKLYEAFLQTGNDEKAGSHGGVELTLIGDNGEASPKLVKQGFYSATQSSVRFRAADVGELKELIITNTAEDDPWYCDFVRVQSEDGAAYPFAVKRWIGLPYDPTVTASLKPSRSLELPAQDVECHTRGSDMFPGIPEELQIFKVNCPMNCQASDFARVEGSSLHPASSSICASAIVDGVLSPSGGEVVVSVVGAVPAYSGLKVDSGLSAAEFVPSPERLTFSYYLYRSHSVDDIGKNVRVVDSYGRLSALGRLEVRRDGVWGSVCGKGDFAKFSPDSAAKACQELGYLHGILLDSCTYVDGQNVCGGKGYPVLVAGVMCNGAETEFADCTFEEPTDFCQDHSNDVALQCTNNPSDREPLPGTLRIVDTVGAPSQSGIGRLEYYLDKWGTVCRDGWTKESERVACLELGYSGLRNGGASEDACSDVNGVNYCGAVKNSIVIVDVACQGEETSLRNCPHQTNNDIYCVHDEDVVIACEGPGDPSGIGLFTKEDLPNVAERQFPPKITLGCGDRPINKPDLHGEPGATFIAECPEGCSEEAGAIKGTFIYSDDSPVCKAAIHTGAIQEKGGDIMVTLGHKQDSLYGTERHEIASESFGPYMRTFTVTYPVSSVKSRTMVEGSEEEKKVDKFAGASSLNTSGHRFPKFKEVDGSPDEIPSRSLLPPKFHWSPSDEWTGFGGKNSDYIDARAVTGGDPTPGFRDFTLSARAKITGGKGSWRTILSHSECDGFQLAVDDKDELVFEQTCSSNFVQSGFKPQLNQWFHIAVTYFQPEKSVAIFVDGALASFENVKNDFDLKTHLTIGRSSGSESDYFIGDISAVRAYDYVLSPDDVKQVMKDSTENPGNGGSSPGSIERRTVDGRLCTSPCSAEEPFVTEMKTGSIPSNVPVSLSCQETLHIPDFNGKTMQKFRVSCPNGCLNEDGKVRGTKVYTEDSSICKAAIHSGAIPPSGGDVVLILHNGLSEYKGSRGHAGILSIDDQKARTRSFSLSRAPEIKTLSCKDNAAFAMKMGVGETELVSCPSGCTSVTEAMVYGTDVYSAESSVCRAAIHSGALDNNGGMVEIIILQQRQHFIGKEKNGILSEKAGHYLRTFTFVSKDHHKTNQELRA